MAQPRRRTTRRYAVRIPFLNRSLTIPNHIISLKSIVHLIIDYGLYLLGPLLIFLALGIIYALVHTFYTILLPLRTQGSYDSMEAMVHQCIVLGLVFQILFNYHACVRTSNSSNGYVQDGDNDKNNKNNKKNKMNAPYEAVVRALASKTGFPYPETRRERTSWGNHWRDLMLTRSRIGRERQRARQVVDDMSETIQKVKRQYNKGQISDNGQAQDSEEIDVELGSSANTKDGPAKHRRARDTVSPRNKNNNNNNNITTTARSTTSAAATPPQRAWMLMDPHEWSHCRKTNLPKPPRSHYDHVTRTLVLNMDHYCPWMFNVVGYFNYRYFCNFLIFVSIGMMYGTWLSWTPFRMLDTFEYVNQIAASRELFHNSTFNQTSSTTEQGNVVVKGNFKLYQVQHLFPLTPTPTERTPIAFCFMICLAVGIAVMGLLLFHLYLISTAQTTIEFHANGIMKRHYESSHGFTAGVGASGAGVQPWKNPYHLGWRRNWEQIWGRPARPFRDWGSLGGWWIGMMVRIMVPSWRLPDFLPVPLKDDAGDWSTTLSKTSQRKKSVDGVNVV